MIKVLLTDDHALVRTGIKRLLEDSGQVEIIAEAESGEECIEKARELRPDVILMDVNMPGIGGLEASRRILLHDPEQKIIILTVHAEQNYPKRLLEIGARGYLTKECLPDEMLSAIRKVHEGGSYIEPKIAQKLALSMLPGHDSNLMDRLSQREFQVLLMVAEGLTNAEISRKLCLSPKTISTYRSRLMEKLEANNEFELVRIAVEYGLVDFDHPPPNDAA